MRLRTYLLPELLFFFVVLSPYIDCSAQGEYSLRDPTVRHRLDAYVKVFVDSGGHASIDQISRNDFQSNFKSTSHLTFGYLKAPLWIKVQTRCASLTEEWYLEIPAPFLEYVDFYEINSSGRWSHYQSGYFRPQSARPVSHTGHVLPLHFNSDSSSTVFIRITGLSPKTFPLYAIQKEKFYSETRFEDIGYGIFFGILIVMFFYNFFIYLTLKQSNYLLYICTIVCTFLIFSSASGYAGKFLWPEAPMMNYYAGRLTLPVLTIFLSIFTIRFMEVRRYSSLMYYALAAMIPLAVIAFVLVITQTLSSAGNNLISASTIIYMTTGIVCSAKGNKTAKYFIAAWTVYLIGGLLLTLRNSGVFDFNFWTTHFVEIGAALETIIIAFALGDRYRRYKLEKEEIQLLAFKAQQEATEKLEMKVNERTEQLSKANEELSATLETNKLQTKIIEDKNAELDAFFYRISHDLKGPISSLLGLTTLARREIKDAKAGEYLQQQHSQVERLNNIISGLINLTKLNDTDLRKERIVFEKMIDDCILSCHGHRQFAAIQFRKNIEPGIEFSSEWTLLNAIFQNLIENAIKYSRDHAPFVLVSVRTQEKTLFIEVEDNGQGIPQDQQGKIFEMFYRATNNAHGTGLGLYILKRSVLRLGGTIRVESKYGEGSKFIVELPF